MVLYHILQSNSRTFRNLASQSRRRRVYHQCVALYITNTKCCISSSRRQDARWRVMRYKGGLPPLMIYTARCAAMICQACGLDKKIREQSSRIFCLKRVKRSKIEVKTNKRSTSILVLGLIKIDM